jgi:hypothetical protein
LKAGADFQGDIFRDIPLLGNDRAEFFHDFYLA